MFYKFSLFTILKIKRKKSVYYSCEWIDNNFSEEDF